MTDKEIIELYTKPKPVTQEMIDRFLNSENETGVSDATSEHGVSHGVRESDAERNEAGESPASVAGPLEKITEGEKIDSCCRTCGSTVNISWGMCKKCWGKTWI